MDRAASCLTWKKQVLLSSPMPVKQICRNSKTEKNTRKQGSVMEAKTITPASCAVGKYRPIVRSASSMAIQPSR